MTKQLNKKGTSLVELIAVIVIMGIIAAVAVPTTIGVIGRQKKSAAVKSANNVLNAAETVLLEANAGQSDTGCEACGTGSTTGYQFVVKVSTLVANGDIKKNPFQDDTNTAYVGTDAVAFAINASNAVIVGKWETANKFTAYTNTQYYKINGITLGWSATDLEFIRTNAPTATSAS